MPVSEEGMCELFENMRKVSKALDQAELIADATYRGAVLRDIYAAQRGGVPHG